MNNGSKRGIFVGVLPLCLSCDYSCVLLDVSPYYFSHSCVDTSLMYFQHIIISVQINNNRDDLFCEKGKLFSLDYCGNFGVPGIKQLAVVEGGNPNEPLFQPT